MLHIFLENGVLSRKTATIVSALLLSSAVGGCSTVMSKDDGSYVGVIADYTPFDMEDDSVFFRNEQPKTPAYLQKSSSPIAQAPHRTTPIEQPVNSLPSIAPTTAQNPTVPQPRKFITATAPIAKVLPTSASVTTATLNKAVALDETVQKSIPLKQVPPSTVSQPQPVKNMNAETKKTLTAHVNPPTLAKAQTKLARNAENLPSGSAVLSEGEPYEGTPEMTSVAERDDNSTLTTAEQQEELN